MKKKGEIHIESSTLKIIAECELVLSILGAIIVSFVLSDKNYVLLACILGGGLLIFVILMVYVGILKNLEYIKDCCKNYMDDDDYKKRP